MGSLFDGIGGFPLAGIHNGICPVWASEIEPFPIRVTKIRFPKMHHVGDITKLDGGRLPPVHVVCGGSPCQDLSVAGQRRGLSGERSGLFMDQVRIVKEMRAADERRGIPDHLIRPRYLVWENVPGAFSSANGEDFRAVIEEIVRIKDHTCHVPRPDTGRWGPAGAAILGDEFSLAWRVLDAQYWGVAQRRRRIFLVADFGGLTAPKILFEQERLLGNPAEGKKTGKGTTGAVKGGFNDTGGDQGIEAEREKRDRSPLCLNDQGGERMDVLEETVPTLRAGMGSHPPLVPQAYAAGVVSKGNGECFLTPEVHTSLTSGGGQAGQGYPCVLTADVSATLCLNNQGGREMECSREVSGTLRAQEHGHQPLVFENHGIDARYSGPHEVAPTMSARYGTGGNNVPLVAKEPESFCITGNIIDRQPQNGGNGIGYQADIAYTLTGMDRHAVFSMQRSDEFLENEVVAAQSARQHKDATDLVCQPYQETVGTIGHSDHKGINSQYVREDKCIVENRNLIRRLTPLECERLQGFPDGWTDIPKASDSARYKALGNSVAIPCVDFVLRGIAYFLRKQEEE
uniref:DNA cytosine methyltransferase n=1 Tax=Enterocloster clostridioformis TaxID=1531 RepID=UPI0026ED2309|nr:DNA cytosine methyltransferase [Enterocloster clostridioformis]